MEDPGINAVERQIREAQARGAFDDLPGAGKPLNLADSRDPDWWVKGLIERERLDLTGALPGPLQLRKEAETYPGSLADVPREEQVREILEDYNRRVREDRLKPVHGLPQQIVAPTVDIDDMVARWAELRRERVTERAAEAAAEREHAKATRARWWRRRARRAG